MEVAPCSDAIYIIHILKIEMGYGLSQDGIIW